MIFNQIRSKDETGTLSYLLADDTSGKGVIIDPNIEDLEKINELISNSKIELKYIIDTHTHADHISAAGELKNLYNAELVMHENTKHKWKVIDEGDKFGIGDILRANAKFEVDKYVNDNDIIEMDGLKLKFLFTPGHTDNHIAVLAGDLLFTGDLLLIEQAGRSDLPGGSTEDQYDSLFNKILQLPENTKIYPGHDYEENAFSYLKDEKKNNPFLQNRTKKEYIEFVKDFFPPLAEAMENGKMILQCGTKRVSTNEEPFHDIDEVQLAQMMKNDPSLTLIDVREPYELAMFGAVPGVKNIPMGKLTRSLDQLPSKTEKIIVVCQSGNRSYEAAHYLSKQGYKYVFNLERGTTSWMRSKNPDVLEFQSMSTR